MSGGRQTMRIMRSWLRKALVPTLALAVAFVSMGGSAFAQSTPRNLRRNRPVTTGAPVVPGAVEPPAGYVIGPEDVLAVVFWREKDLSVDAAVRPDGRITVPLLNDLPAAGLTPDQLRERIQTAASQVRRGSERDRRGQGDQQPEGLHHRQYRQARPVPAGWTDNGDAADCDGGWAS